MSYGRFKFRRDTAANWTSVNPVLAAGEIALETDTSPYRVKIGNGSTAWVSLDYWAIAAADITDSTTVGRAVLTAANAAAARTAIGAGTGNGSSDFSGVYSDLTGKPTLGTASALNVAASGNAAAGEVVKGDDTRLGTGGTPLVIPIACSDEVTALTTGVAKVTFRMPCAMTLTAVRASLTTAQASGSIFTVDINEGGTTILSTKLTIDNTEKTSTTAAIPAVISDTALADDAEMTIDIDQIGNGTAKSLKVYLIGWPA